MKSQVEIFAKRHVIILFTILVPAILASETSNFQTSEIFQTITIIANRTTLKTNGGANYAIPKSESLSENFPNLKHVSQIAFDHRIKSVCVQSGLWAIFNALNYRDVGAILYASGIPDDKACTNDALQIAPNPDYNSIRHIGNRRLLQSGISFYFGKFFTGPELYFDGTILKLHEAIRIQSFGFTGITNWTVFEQLDFKGHSSCLVSLYDPVDTKQYDSVTYNKDVNMIIGSVRQGCANEKFETTKIDVVNELQIQIQSNTKSSKISTNGNELRFPTPQLHVFTYEIIGSSNWTIYSEIDLTGTSKCLVALESASLHLTLEIGSIRKGCSQEESLHQQRQPRFFQQLSKSTTIDPQQSELLRTTTPTNSIFFISFLIVLSILILAVVMSISIISYFQCKKTILK